MGGWGRDESGLRAWGCVRNEWSALGSRHTVVTVGACVYTCTHARRDQRTTSRRRHKSRYTQALCTQKRTRTVKRQGQSQREKNARQAQLRDHTGSPSYSPQSLLPFLFFRKLLKNWQPHHWGLTIKRANRDGEGQSVETNVWEVPFCNQHWTPLSRVPHQDHSRLPHP